MSDLYVLNGHEPVPIEDVLTWGAWLETANRSVARTSLPGYLVSTVFLGIDHGWGRRRELFETMVFTEREAAVDEFTRRYATWDEAAQGHEEVVAAVEEHRRTL